jgi:hypothetical protein
MNLTVEERFEPYRSGDIVLSAGEGIGDLIIFFGRHSTIQHSAVLVWLDKAEADKGNIKVVPYFIDDDTTVLSFLGLAPGKKTDSVTKQKHKGMILFQPEDMFKNAPLIYMRALNQQYISDEYVCKKLQEYIEMHHLKTKYAYGFLYLITTGTGYDVFGKHKSGVLCSESIYNFLKHLCDYPNFKLDQIVDNPEEFQQDFDNQSEIKVKSLNNSYIPEHQDYKVPDAKDYMYVPDFFASANNNHPIFEEKEYQIYGEKSDKDVTVWHPYFVTFAIIVILVLFIFFVINNYCESCNATGICARPKIQKNYIF